MGSAKASLFIFLSYNIYNKIHKIGFKRDQVQNRKK